MNTSDAHRYAPSMIGSSVNSRNDSVGAVRGLLLRDASVAGLVFCCAARSALSGIASHRFSAASERSLRSSFAFLDLR